jgi:hypothetical protein
MITAACFVEHAGLQPGQGFIVQGFTSYSGEGGKKVKLIRMLNPWKKPVDSGP